MIMKRQKAAALLAAGMLLAAALLFHLLSWPALNNSALLLATLISGYPIVKKTLQSLRLKAFSIELLVSLATAGALFLGEYVEAAAVTFLFRLGAYLEALTLDKTRAALKSLIAMAPAEAIVVRDGVQATILAEDIVRGDRVRIPSGGKIAVDGRVVSGQALVNEAAITGESMPVAKRAQDRVLSGTTVDTGYLEVIAEQVGDDTTFAKIIELVEEAQESKAKAQQFLEKFASFYTPAILLLSALVYLFSKNTELALTFLVIACPGALVISAPVSMVAGIGNGARRGVLIKGGEYMERLARVDAIVFDKTGTLTKGQPGVVNLRTYGMGEAELLTLAAETEAVSEHVLGRAIIRAAKERDLKLLHSPSEVEVAKGHGIKATVREKAVMIGNRNWMAGNGVAIPDEAGAYAVEQETKGYTAVFVSVGATLSGVVAIADPIRQEARDTIRRLKRQGVKRILMLTGDNRLAAEHAAAQIGIDDIVAELLPADKARHIERLKEQGYRVAMIGDGINDAPAIATADLGLAMGGTGTDVAIETADIVIMADRLDKLVHARQLAKATVRNMKQNMLLAVAVVFVLLAGVLTERVFLASGMFIHEFSVLLVILNAVRLVRYGKTTGSS
ncbi:heavy metal translocating P-type ATPase [Paenibacillus macerans]|uniref:heavy metal translocating P-type ATPase n=1 Tax=Paenibacillus macerans TaxID=44252 RepID=UPI003D31DB0E